MAIKENIIYFMKKTGYKKSDIAKLSGIPYTTLDGILKKGDENIKLSTLKKLSSFMSCTLDELIQDNLENNHISLSNKDSLHTNQDDMFIETMDSMIDNLAQNYHLSEIDVDIIKNYVQLSEKDRQTFISIAKTLIKTNSKKNHNSSIQNQNYDNKTDDNLTVDEKVQLFRQELEAEEKETTSSASTGTNGM